MILSRLLGAWRAQGGDGGFRGRRPARPRPRTVIFESLENRLLLPAGPEILPALDLALSPVLDETPLVAEIDPSPARVAAFRATPEEAPALAVSQPPTFQPLGFQPLVVESAGAEPLSAGGPEDAVTGSGWAGPEMLVPEMRGPERLGPPAEGA